jgi:hypothetical protein
VSKRLVEANMRISAVTDMHKTITGNLQAMYQCNVHSKGKTVPNYCFPKGGDPNLHKQLFGLDFRHWANKIEVSISRSLTMALLLPDIYY